jgi:hypothetical protein
MVDESNFRHLEKRAPVTKRVLGSIKKKRSTLVKGRINDEPSQITKRVETTGLNTKKEGRFHTVYSLRAKIGYYHAPISDSGLWFWELSLVSEQLRGYPRGHATTEQAALSAIEEFFLRWCAAAGLRGEET